MRTAKIIAYSISQVDFAQCRIDLILVIGRIFTYIQFSSPKNGKNIEKRLKSHIKLEKCMILLFTLPKINDILIIR